MGTRFLGQGNPHGVENHRWRILRRASHASHRLPFSRWVHVIVIPAESGLGDAGLSLAPRNPRGIHCAGNRGLEFSYCGSSPPLRCGGVLASANLKGCWVARAQEGVPQPVAGPARSYPWQGVSRQYRTSKLSAGYVLGVHEVAVVPEPIPVVGFPPMCL
jgi:hypothetical protein